MYYREKYEEGKWWYQDTPNGNWIEFSKEKYARTIQQLQEENKKLKEENKEIRGAIQIDSTERVNLRKQIKQLKQEKQELLNNVWQKWCESESTQEFDKWLHDKIN